MLPIYRKCSEVYSEILSIGEQVLIHYLNVNHTNVLHSLEIKQTVTLVWNLEYVRVIACECLRACLCISIFFFFYVIVSKAELHMT